MADLKAVIEQRFPVLVDHLPNVVTAVNHEFAFDEDFLQENDEVAVFPPVSGGSGADFPTVLAIQEAEFDLNQVVAEITLPTTGAVCFFTGVVRALTERGKVKMTKCLEYEAYTTMAELKLKQVSDEIRLEWPQIEGIAIIQRVGVLHPGTPTVLIACSASHRDTGVFEAARYGIDRLKEIVPVWKKEIGTSGETWVEGSYQPGRDD